jgi:hypothetical protein
MFVGLYTLSITTGWWLSPTRLKNDGRIVSWDDSYSQYDGKVIKFMYQITNQYQLQLYPPHTIGAPNDVRQLNYRKTGASP